MQSKYLRETSAVMTMGELFSDIGGQEIARQVLAKNGDSRDVLRELHARQLRGGSMDEVLGIDIPDNDIKGYSISRAINAQAKRDMKEAGLELAVSKHIARVTGRDPEGVFIPFRALTRNFDMGTANQAGNLGGSPVQHNLLGDPLRATLTLTRLGALMLGGFKADFTVPRFTSSATAAYKTETAAFSDSTQNTGVATF
jgi:hypothetical protein